MSHHTEYPMPDPNQFANMLAEALADLHVPLDVYVPDEPDTDPTALAAFHLSGAIAAVVMMIYNNVMEQSSMPTNHLSGSTWARGFQEACQAQLLPEHLPQLEMRVSALYSRLIHQAFGFFGIVAVAKRSTAASLFLDAAHGLIVADAVEQFHVSDAALHHSIGGDTVTEAMERARASARSALEALEQLG